MSTESEPSKIIPGPWAERVPQKGVNVDEILDKLQIAVHNVLTGALAQADYAGSLPAALQKSLKDHEAEFVALVQRDVYQAILSAADTKKQIAIDKYILETQQEYNFFYELWLAQSGHPECREALPRIIQDMRGEAMSAVQGMLPEPHVEVPMGIVPSGIEFKEPVEAQNINNMVAFVPPAIEETSSPSVTRENYTRTVIDTDEKETGWKERVQSHASANKIIDTDLLLETAAITTGNVIAAALRDDGVATALPPAAQAALKAHEADFAAIMERYAYKDILYAIDTDKKVDMIPYVKAAVRKLEQLGDTLAREAGSFEKIIPIRKAVDEIRKKVLSDIDPMMPKSLAGVPDFN